MRRLLLITCLAVTAAVAVAHASGGSEATFAANQRSARSFAERELAAVTLPAGAQEAATDPSAGRVLGQSLSRPGTTKLIDVHRFWRLPGSTQALTQWLAGHAPEGTIPAGSGSAGNRSGTYEWLRSYSYRSLPGSVYLAELDFSIARAGGGGTALRVDSFAAGLEPRPSWERIPSDVTSIDVAVDRFDHKRGYPVATVTNATLVRRLVGMFNAFQIVQPGAAFGCPLITAATPLLHFRFRAASGETLAEAAEAPCVGMSFTLGGRSGPDLQPEIDLSQLLWADHVLAVCFALSVSAGPVTRTPPPRWFSVQFQIEDAGSNACGLRGYPSVKLINNSGGTLVPHVTRIPAGHPVTPPVLLIDPSWPASTWISWPATPSCKALPFTRVQLRLPGVRPRLVVRLRRAISPCGGRLTVAPVGG